ncbi:hypothetical protein, partial [Aliiruegeria sabulilitoris]|uniref:hypothetical protein n=1 Tax=Aliiruegeria sabulilitoris TaxID=1510458 RepID=UPI0012E37D3F
MKQLAFPPAIWMRITVFCFLAIVGATQASSTVTDWSMFVDFDSHGKVCWAVTEAKDRRGTLVFVTIHKGDRQPEVAIKIVPYPKSASRLSRKRWLRATCLQVDGL